MPRAEWEERVIDALAATGRPYVVIVVDAPIAPGETQWVAGPVLWARSNMVRDSLLVVVKRAFESMQREESTTDESAKSSAN